VGVLSLPFSIANSHFSIYDFQSLKIECRKAVIGYWTKPLL